MERARSQTPIACAPKWGSVGCKRVAMHLPRACGAEPPRCATDWFGAQREPEAHTGVSRCISISHKIALDCQWQPISDFSRPSRIEGIEVGVRRATRYLQKNPHAALTCGAAGEAVM